jgi:alginate O-acetyltransferase complex protein AlgI
LWHGASWNFVIWGLFHGALLISERMGLLKWLGKVPKPVGHVYAMLAILVGWVFSRAETLPQALNYLGAMGGLKHGPARAFHTGFFLNRELLLAMAAGLIGCAPVVPAVVRWHERMTERHKGAARTLLEGGMGFVRAATVALIFVASTTLSAAGTYNPFIYFRF